MLVRPTVIHKVQRMNLFQALQWATVEDGWARAVQQKKILKKELHTHAQV